MYEKPKLLFVGLFEGLLGTPLAMAAADYGYEVQPVHVACGVSGGDGYRPKTAVVEQFFERYERVSSGTGLVLNEEAVREVLQGDTILVHTGAQYHPLAVEVFARYGVPIILLGEYGYRTQSSEDLERFRRTEEQVRKAGKPFSVLQAPGYTVEGEALLNSYQSLDPGTLGRGEARILDVKHPGPTSALALDLKEAFRHLGLSVDMGTKRGDDWEHMKSVPFEYRDFYQYTRVELLRDGITQRHEVEIRGSEAYVDSFYHDLLPWFVEALEMNQRPGWQGLGHVAPHVL